MGWCVSNRAVKRRYCFFIVGADSFQTALADKGRLKGLPSVDCVFDGDNEADLLADGGFVVSAAVVVVATAAAVGVDVKRALRSRTHRADFAAAGFGKLCGAFLRVFSGLGNQVAFDGFEIEIGRAHV